jgi:hypothetical protein
LRLVVAIAALTGCALAVDAVAASAGLTRIVSPASNQVVGSGGVPALAMATERLVSTHAVVPALSPPGSSGPRRREA